MRHVECCHTPKREPLSHASTRKGRCGSTWAQQIGAFALKGVALHYYAHHIGDFIRDTSRLSDPQAMAYLRLIWLYYETERPLPDDKPVLALRIGSDVETVGALLNAYFSYENGVWYHKRIESEIRKFSEKQARAKQANASRWSKRGLKSETLSDADKKRHRSRTDPNQEPITNNQEPLNKKQGDTAPDGATPFDEFWQTWPSNKRKGAKDKCLKVWQSKGFDLQSAEILAHVRIMSKSNDWIKENGEFIPAPLTYLNQSRWSGSDSVIAEKKMNQPVIDPVLEKLKHDAEKAIPIPENIKAKLGLLVDHLRMQ